MPERKPDMKPGEFFNPDGYEHMAVIQCDLGDVLVLGNNSTHFLIAVRYEESMTDGEIQEVELIDSFRYGAEFKPALREALNFAVGYALLKTR